MFLPSYFRVWHHIPHAQLAHCSLRLRWCSHVLMSVELVQVIGNFACVAELVVVGVLALSSQVVVQGGNLNDLLALPACNQHGALAPVVNI